MPRKTSVAAPPPPDHVRAMRTSVLADGVFNRGKCAQVLVSGEAEDLWHPTARDGSDLSAGPEYDRRAAAACRGCRVKDECLEWALRLESRRAGEPYGVYGGLSPAARAPLVADRREQRVARRRGEPR